MQIKIAAPLGGDAIIEFDDNEEVSGRLSIISGDITEDMIAEAIAGANPNSYMGFVNAIDAPQLMFSERCIFTLAGLLIGQQ